MNGGIALVEETTTLIGLNSFWSLLNAGQDCDSGESLKAVWSGLYWLEWSSSSIWLKSIAGCVARKGERRFNIFDYWPWFLTRCRSSSPRWGDNTRIRNLGEENHELCPASHGASVWRKRQHSYVDSVLLLLGSRRAFQNVYRPTLAVTPTKL